MRRIFGVALRISLLGAALLAAAASSGQSSRQPAQTGPQAPHGAPQATQMEPAMALGLWRSSFGPVKIEPDDTGGPSNVMGVWVYERHGQQVIGFFSGALDGNVLTYTWDEPTDNAPLRGSGYLVFDPGGKSFTGQWWTESRDRSGQWNGWRDGAPPASQPGSDPGHADQDVDEGEGGVEYDPAP